MLRTCLARGIAITVNAEALEKLCQKQKPGPSCAEATAAAATTSYARRRRWWKFAQVSSEVKIFRAQGPHVGDLVEHVHFCVCIPSYP